jgi:hypothetical protein
VILFGRLIWRRVAEYAIYPDAARGYLAGEQDPEGDPGVGLLTVNAVPSGREIEVRHRLTRTVVATTFSAADGTWQVPDLPSLDEYDIIARDHAGVYEDVIVGAQLPYVPA